MNKIEEPNNSENGELDPQRQEIADILKKPSDEDLFDAVVDLISIGDQESIDKAFIQARIIKNKTSKEKAFAVIYEKMALIAKEKGNPEEALRIANLIENESLRRMVIENLNKQ